MIEFLFFVGALSVAGLSMYGIVNLSLIHI